MQISAKATFLGFAQALDPLTGQLEIAGVQIALAHTGGARAGDVLQVEAVRDTQGAWSGIISARLSPVEMMERNTPVATPSPQAPSPACAAGQRFANVNGVRTAAAPASSPNPAPQSSERATAGPGAQRVGRFNVSRSSAGTPSGATQAPARPRFIPTSTDERVRY
ncbi:MAG TPA: hypothetical protein VN259_09060 [Xanthomonadales bacterium]|nr:hypothetical protein [Xanthomonadales bacterium]